MAMNKSKISRRHWVMTFDSGWCGTCSMMKLWNTCPRCNAAKETCTHILQCRAMSVSIQWEKSIMELSKWLEENRTCQDISNLLIQALDQWRRGQKDYAFDGMKNIFES